MTLTGQRTPTDPVHSASLGEAELHLFASSNMWINKRELPTCWNWPIFGPKQLKHKEGFTFQVENAQTIRKKASRQKYCILALASLFGKEKSTPLTGWTWISRKHWNIFLEIFRHSDTNFPTSMAKCHQKRAWHRCHIAWYLKTYISEELQWLLPGELEHKVYCGGVKEFNHFFWKNDLHFKPWASVILEMNLPTSLWTKQNIWRCGRLCFGC